MNVKTEMIFFLLIMLFLVSPIALADSSISDDLKAITEKIVKINGADAGCVIQTESVVQHFNSKDSCRKFEGDPFEPGATVISGEDQGKCLDTTNYRPIKILSSSQMREFGFTPDPNKIVIGNFEHLGNFYVAEIPIEEIDDLIFQITNFPSPVPLISLGHAQVRVQFNKNIKLVPQVNGKGKTQNLKEMILSIHAVGAQNDYDPIGKGRDGSYSSGMAVFSTASKVKRQKEEQNRVDQYKMELTEAQKKEYVLKYLKQSDEKQLSDKYDTIGNNCGNMQFALFDEVVDYSGKQKRMMRGLRERFGVMNPPGAPRSLKARGIITSNKFNRLPNMDEDSTLLSIYNSLK